MRRAHPSIGTGGVAGSLLAGVVVAAGSAAASLALAGTVLVADPAGALDARLDGQVWIAEGERFTARVTLLDDASRRRWLRETAEIEVDPFAPARPDAGQAFLTFLVSIERRGVGRLHFQPLSSSLSTSQGVISTPLDMATIETTYAMVDREMPPAYAALRRVLLQDPMTLEDGGRATGLLAYRAGGLDGRTLRLEIRLTTDAGDSPSFRIAYRRVKVKRERPSR